MSEYNTSPGYYCTPGPWKITSNHQGHVLINSEHWGDSICQVSYPNEGEWGRDANALLIAAAPDLLDTLERLVYGEATKSKRALDDLIERARRNIEKAYGIQGASA